jgi:hypothetical protein
MAFFRFNRDKRGYEHFYIVEPVTNRRGKSRPRVLYWYRTPPNVRVGRAPFDQDVQRALEAQNPNVTFDWSKIIDAPIPSADAEKWRERRRAERAEKAARRMTTAVEEPADDIADGASLIADLEFASPAEATSEPSSITATTTPAQTALPAGGAGAVRKRRRRRRGRGQRPELPHAAAASVLPGVAQEPTQPAAASAPAESIEASTPTETPGD